MPCQSSSPKNRAIALITTETGRGRRIIERVFDRLEAEGRIRVYKDFDGRSYNISRDDVELVIKIIKREIE